MSVYEQVISFKAKYPMTVAWRLHKHAKIMEQHLNEGEVPTYSFCAQKNNNVFDYTSTYVITLTNKRLLLATKRVLFGYFFISITPDMFNDLKIEKKIIWGKVLIDTVKEFITLSNVDKDALIEIESKITNFMMEEKKKYGIDHHHHHQKSEE